MGFPQIDACIVCEGARQELLGKYILFGFFGITPHVQVALQNCSIPATLCFIFCGGPGEGRFNIGMRVTDADGAVVPGQAADIVNGELLKVKTGTSIFMSFQGTFPKPGRYRVTLSVNKVDHYSTVIDIVQMDGQ